MSSAGRYPSPLRYPGGKRALGDLFADVVERQWSPLDIEIWVEPFAGGAGVGLHLLQRDLIEEVWLSEADPNMAAWWSVVLSDPDGFAGRVADAPIPTVATFRDAQSTLADPTATQFERAWAVFVVNRCSRSGIVRADRVGPMGGWGQSAATKIGDRWDGEALASRVAQLGRWRHRIRFTAGDGIGLVAELDGRVGIEDEMVVFADPPYVTRQAARLYATSFGEVQHRRLADALNGCAARWVATYDDDPLVRALYADRRVEPLPMAYSVGRRRRAATELVILSDNLAWPAADA